MIKTVQIKDLGDIITGNTPPRNTPDYYGCFVPFIKATDIDPSSKYTYFPEEYYSEKGFEKYKKSLIPKGSTCVVTIGSIGQKMTMAHCDCFINQAMNAIIPNEQFDPEYVYYVTKNNIHKLKMLDSGTASGRENVSKSAFANMEIQIVVDITSQKKIGAILAAYDALIENNQKQIKLLEEAAQRLYKEWFVVDNMPKEWRRTNINEILTFHRGYDLTKTAMKDGPYPVIGSTSILGYHNEYKTGGPGIVTGRSGSLGQYQLVWENYWPHNTSLYVSDFKGHNIFYIFNLLKTVDFSALNNGGAIPTLNRNVLSNIEIFEPVKDLQEKYAVVVEPFYQKIRILSIQNQKLLESRDRLLPKLMSGEIEV